MANLLDGLARTDQVESTLATMPGNVSAERDQLDQILHEQRRLSLDSYNRIATWFASWSRSTRLADCAGAPSALAGEAAGLGGLLRTTAAAAFSRWESSVAVALEAMRQRGEVADGADPAELAEAVIANIEGGYLISSFKGRSPPDTGRPWGGAALPGVVRVDRRSGVALDFAVPESTVTRVRAPMPR